jgi:small subunit ribosomal protein S1
MTYPGTCKGGFNVEILQRRAFCPFSQIDIIYVETPENYVGQRYSFLITQFEEKGGNIVVSQRKLRERERDALQKEVYQNLTVDSEWDDTAMRIMPFGGFVDISHGVEGMVHISEMSYEKRVLNREEIVTPKETVSVLIKDMDLAKRRIPLSLKDAQGDPWASFTGNFSEGQSITGALEKNEKFGLFIKLAPGVVGLLPQSKINQSPERATLESLN